MSRRDTGVVIVHAVPTIGLFLQGVLYIVTPRFMPYHADALGVTWEALPSHYQGFLLGVIKAMGAGSIAVTLALMLLLWIPFRRGERWARWAVPVVGMTFTTLTAYAAYTIDINTPASTPWRQTCLLAMLYLAGGLASYWPVQGGRTRRGPSHA